MLKEGYYILTGKQMGRLPFPETAKAAREVAAEGMVLLRNDGILPFHGKKLALFGAGASDTVSCGTGSGYAFSPYRVSVLQGLQDAGIEITSAAWLAKYRKALKQSGKNGKKLTLIDKRWSGITPEVEEPEITASDIQSAKAADTAVYVIRRNTGENFDRKAIKGDYYLSDREEENLQSIAGSFAHTIVLLNTCVIDAVAIGSIPGVSAILLMGQAGMEAGHALADVLTGKVSPSGKLTDTWAKRYEDYPASATFSANDGCTEREDYTEDIFVGYRHFDSLGLDVEYPFGFGLSYTDFRIDCTSVKADWKQITVTAKVRNVGNAAGKEVVQIYASAPAGRLPKPWQELKAYEKTPELAPGQETELILTFATENLASYDEAKAAWVMEQGDYLIRVGNSSRSTVAAAVLRLDKDAVTRQVSNHLTGAALSECPDSLTEKTFSGTSGCHAQQSFPENSGLSAEEISSEESGHHAQQLSSEDSCHLAQKSSQVASAYPTKESSSENSCRPAQESFQITSGLSAEESSQVGSVPSAQRTSINPGSHFSRKPESPDAPVLPLFASECVTIDNISRIPKETVTYVPENSAYTLPERKYHFPFPLAERVERVRHRPKATLPDVKAGRVTMEEFVASLDTETLLRIVTGIGNETKHPVPSRAGSSKYKNTIALAASGKTTAQYTKTLGIPALSMCDGPAGLHLMGSNCTTFPVGLVLAQTWNKAAASRIGNCFGMELEQYHVHIALGPGMNIHRDPLCGRNFEYFSEDPLLTGKTAAAFTLGLQENHPGYGVALKHFACNNQELDRTTMTSNLSERALREIYLKGFEICVREAKPLTVMSSYNCINGIHTSSRYDLITDILRGEWGFDGFVMTDWDSKSEKPFDFHAGNDIIMGGYPTDIIAAALTGAAPVFEEDGAVHQTKIAAYGGFFHNTLEAWNSFQPDKDGKDRVIAHVPAGKALSPRVTEAVEKGMAEIKDQTDGSRQVIWHGTDRGAWLPLGDIQKCAIRVLTGIMNSAAMADLERESK